MVVLDPTGVLLGALLVLDATLLVLLLCRASSSNLPRRAARTAGSFLARLWAKTWVAEEQADEESGRSGPRKDELDDLHKQVAEAVANQYVRITQAGNVIFAVVILARRATIYLDLVLGKAPLHLGSAGVAIHCAMVSLPLVGLACPQSVRKRTLWMWHVAYMACACALASPAGGNALAMFMGARPPLHFLTTTSAILCMDLCLAICTNLCFGAFGVYTFMSSPALNSQLPGSIIYVSEFFIVVAKAFIVWSIGDLLRARAELEVGQSQRSAIFRLLGLSCDAVADLGEDLCLKEHDASLASLLIHGPGRSLQGASILDCTAPGEDRDRLERGLAGGLGGAGGDCGGGGPGAALFGGHLCDSMGNRVKVAVFHVPYRTAAGRVNHFVGFREDADAADLPTVDELRAQRVAKRAEARAALAMEQVPTLQSPRRQPGSQMSPMSARSPMSVRSPLPLEGLRRPSSSQGSPASSASSSPASSVHSSTSDPPSADRLAAVVSLEDGLPITWATEMLSNRFGVTPGAARFADIVVEADWPGLAARLRGHVDMGTGVAGPGRSVALGCCRMRSARSGQAEAGKRRVHLSFPSAYAAKDCVGVQLGSLRAAAGGAGTSAKAPAPRLLGRARGPEVAPAAVAAAAKSSSSTSL